MSMFAHHADTLIDHVPAPDASELTVVETLADSEHHHEEGWLSYKARKDFEKNGKEREKAMKGNYEY